MGPAIVHYLRLDDWKYEVFFDPAPARSQTREWNIDWVVDLVEGAVSDAELDKHPFFELAALSPDVLLMWVSQELVMTNAFSQMVLFAASRLQNGHDRAVLTEVARGEHGRIRKGIADRAHPTLLERLRQSIGLSRSNVFPLPPTRDFITRLATELSEPLRAVTFIGVGNERLIEPEYTAVKQLFQLHRHLWPEADVNEFLDANLDEDRTHSRLCLELASSYIRTQAAAEQFRTAVREAIASRLLYFDELAVHASRSV